MYFAARVLDSLCCREQQVHLESEEVEDTIVTPSKTVRALPTHTAVYFGMQDFAPAVLSLPVRGVRICFGMGSESL